MRFVTPKVYVIGGTQIYRPAMERYLLDQGVDDWKLPVGVSDGEVLIEFYGRLCYASFGTQLNDNISRIRESTHDYIVNILASHHGSVIEHTTLNLLFSNCSRILTHELVRHRAGVAVSQESMRYVRTDEIDVWVPSIMDTDDMRADIKRKMEEDEGWARHFISKLGVDDMKDFGRKKEATSAIRRFVSPQGVGTEIGWTANLRALRHVIEDRTAEGAEEEIRFVFDMVAQEAIECFPHVFSDFVRSENGVWAPKWRKV